MGEIRLRRVAALLLVLLLSLLGAGPSISAGAINPIAQDIPDSYQAVAENAAFRLYVDSKTLAFKLLDKRSGYLWQSAVDKPQSGDRLNKSWQAFALSGISIEYLDETANTKRISITNATHTLTVNPIADGVSAVVTFQDYGITVGVNLLLEADGVRVELPFSAIRAADPKFRLGVVYVYPFLGATRGGSVPGYMFIPDGTGSLIRFADSTRAKNMFYGRYYGADLGMIGTQPYDPRINAPMPITYPVFGMVHGEGQNAFLSVVEKGAAYGELQVHPAGIITNFNFLYTAFIYNQSYFQATNRSGDGVTTVQKQPNAFDAVIHYRFLTGDAASIIGMARSYQGYLLAGGHLHKADDANPASANIGIRLEFLGGDVERVMLWDRFVAMTTLAQMRAILDGLKLPNPQVIYYGWQPSGATYMPPTSLALEGALGSLTELRDVAASVAANGGRFSLYLDPQAALYGRGGYSPRNDLAQAITGGNLEAYHRFPNYLFTFDSLRERYTAFSSDLAARTQAPQAAEKFQLGLALDGIGATLYGDFREGHTLNREAASAAYHDLLKGTPLQMGYYHPNAYLYDLMDAYYDMPLGDNGYTYAAEAVPFLPIVLAGYVPYYGPALNFSSDVQADLLRQADFGIYPSYFVTYQPTSALLNTPSSWIYSSSYAQWGDPIRQGYAWLNALLGPVRGQPIIARQKVAEGVYATIYGNGRQIIVNYTEQPFTQGGLTVAAKDAALVEGKP